MKKLLLHPLIAVILLLTSTIYSQYDPFDFFAKRNVTLYSSVISIDTTTYPLTPYGNGWLVFNGTSNKQFARTRDIDFLEFPYSVTDSFRITTKIKIGLRKAMWICGKYAGGTGDWVLAFNSNSGNTIEFYMNGWKSIKVLGSTDTLWYKIDVVFNKGASTLKCYYNDTLAITTTSFTYTNGVNNNSFVIGHAQMPANYGDPTTGAGNPGTHFFDGKMDYLYIHDWQSGVDSAVLYNFNEGAGQNMYDSLSYTAFDRASPDGTTLSNHLCSGWNPGLDTQDVTFSKGTRKNTTNVVTMANGLWQWASPTSFIQSFTNGMCVWNSGLVPTAGFNRVNVTQYSTHNGDTSAYYTYWNGTTYSKLGSNGSYFTGSITQSYNQNDTLWAGGSFTNAGGNALADNIAYFVSGGQWTVADSGLDNGVYCFSTFNGQLVTGGAFNASGGTTITSSVARWTGSAWVAVGTSDIGEVWSLEVYSSSLYAGTSQGLYKFNGTNWDLISSLSGATIYCLQSFNSQLWYGGTGGTLGYYDGSTHSMGTVSGFTTHVIEFTTDGTDLYITGSFYRIVYNGVNTVCNKLARWNKREYSAVNYGADERPEDLAIYNGKLAFTGDFFVVDGVAVQNINLITIP